MIAIIFIAVVLGYAAYDASTCKHRDSVRTVIGGFRCPDCGKIGQSFEDMGYPHGYISRANPLLQRTR